MSLRAVEMARKNDAITWLRHSDAFKTLRGCLKELKFFPQYIADFKECPTLRFIYVQKGYFKGCFTVSSDIK